MILPQNCNSNFCIPKYRFQVLDFTVTRGSNVKDMEIAINEKNIESHDKVVGAFLLDNSNRIKQVRLCTDETSVFPEGMLGQLVTKEIVDAGSIANGIFTKHLVWYRFPTSFIHAI